MSNQDFTHSLINDTNEEFDPVLKVAISNANEPSGNTKSETLLNDNVSANSEPSNESNKTFLLNKFLKNSNEEFYINKDLIATAMPPIPKPRKSKTILPQEAVNSVYKNNSASSQKTYIVDDNVKINNKEAVKVLIHNRPMSSDINKVSRKNSTHSDKTYTKSISNTSKLLEEKNIIPASSKENSHDHISVEESKISSEKETEVNVITNSENVAETNCKYNYEKIVEVVIHKADALQIDSYVTHPSVKVHIVDINTGKYYPKSSKGRSVVFYYENEGQDYILPVMTSSYNLQEKRTFSPEWEESVLLNEDFSYLVNENIIMFFEVLDYVPYISKKFNVLQKNCYKGWHRIAYAFLKIVGKDQSLNLNKKVKLQLYYPKETKQKDTSVCDLWYIWKSYKLQKYPSALYITVKEVISPKTIIETFRSKTPLQKESISNLRINKPNFLNIKTNKKDVSKVGSNDSRENFEMPDKPVVEIDSYDNGCFLFKFSNNGLYIACAVQIKETFTVFVYEVNNLEEEYCVNDHRGLIYCINWSLDDSLLLTASADNTVAVWNFSTNSFLQILPHPIYVYTSQINSDNTIIATGCFDKTVRIWLFNKEEEKYKLHQEMEEHEGYVTSVCFNEKSTNLYSSDSVGHIIEWSKLKNSDWKFERDISTPDLKNTVINEILMFPKEKKMLVHSRDSILRIISIKRACVLHWLQGALNSRIQTFCSVSPCGNYVTSGSENGLVVVWDAKTGKDVMTYEPFLNHFQLETVHCAQFHPKENFIAFSHFGSICPILLYHYNAKKDTKWKGTLPYLFHKNNEHCTVEEPNVKEKISFHDVLEKIDKLLQ